MSQQSTDTDADSASVLSASSAASYQRRKKVKEQPNSHHSQVLMSVSDYSDYSRYPKFTAKTVQKEGPGIRTRGTTTYDDNALPGSYHPVTKNTTGRGDEGRHRRHRYRRSSSPTTPQIRQEVKAVPNPAVPGGVMPHVVTHVHLSPPHRSRRHRSASREPPPTASRPVYGRRRSRSYDDGHRSRTHIINLPPPPVASINPGHMYGGTQSLPPLRPLPGSPEFGYGRPVAAPSGYTGTPPFVPQRPRDITAFGPGASPAMAASAAGPPYPSSRRRAISNAYSPPSAASLSPYRGAPRNGMSSQYSPYGGSSSTTPNVSVVSPTVSSAPIPASGYGSASASRVYSAQNGYSAPMGSTTAPVVINLPPAGGMMAQQPMMTGSRRARAASMSGIGYGTNTMGTGANPYGGSVAAPRADLGNPFRGGVGNYPAPPVGSGFRGQGYGSGGLTSGLYDERNPYGAGNVGYGQSANGVYGFGPGQARDPIPGGGAPSPPPTQMPPGTGFWGGLFKRRSPKLDGSDDDDLYTEGQNHGRHRRRRHHN